MIIDSYEEFLINAKECKKIYNEFSCTFFNKKPLLNHKYRWKKIVYKIPCKRGLEYKRDVIWLYMNNDLGYDEMKVILERKQ